MTITSAAPVSPVVPAGLLIPSLGQNVNATATLTITGGTGRFAGASGSFPVTPAQAVETTPAAYATAYGIRIFGAGRIRLLTFDDCE